jgi:hypothetical protein
MLTPGFHHRLYIFWAPEACLRTNGPETFDKPPFCGAPEPVARIPAGLTGVGG